MTLFLWKDFPEHRLPRIMIEFLYAYDNLYIFIRKLLCVLYFLQLKTGVSYTISCSVNVLNDLMGECIIL